MATVKDSWKRSILLEIVNRNNPSQVIEAFTLIIPPESIEIEETQRVSRRKTFGGIFIDDYGPDVGKITISGTTGNTDIKETYIPESLGISIPKGLTGKQAFFYMRDRLMRYKTHQKIRNNYEQYDFRLYDLSSVPDKLLSNNLTGTAYREKTPANTVEAQSEGYVVNLDRFRVSRSKDRPLWYHYTIEFVVLRPLGTFKADTTPRITPSNPKDLIQVIRRSLNTIRTAFIRVRSIKDKVEDAINFTSSVITELGNFFDETNDVILYPASTTKLLLGKVKDVVDAMDDYVKNGPNLASKTIEEYYKIIKLGKDIAMGCASLVTYAKTPESSGVSKIKTSSSLSGTEDLSSRYIATTEDDSYLYSNIVDIDTSNKKVFSSTGYVPVTITSTTRLDELALEYYGDPSLQEIIAVYNGISDIEELEIGDVLKIPVLVESDLASKNLVYSTIPSDIYGSDLKLDSSGKLIVASSGDFMTIEGPDNLIQALNLRLSEELGNRLRLVVYGLRTQVGFPMNTKEPISYIITNIKDTILQDPRITDIMNMKLKGENDSLYMTFDAITIKIGDVIPYKGNI